MIEERLVARAQAGDERAFEDLTRRYAAMGRWMTRRLYAPGLELQDLEQVARMGLFGAVRNFDPERGEAFVTLARVAIERALISAVVAARRAKHRYLNESLSLDAEMAGQFNDPFHEVVEDHRGVDPHRALEQKEELATVLRVVREELSPLERESLVGLLNGESYIETERRLVALGDGKRPGRAMYSKAKVVDNALVRARLKVGRALSEESPPLGVAA